MTILVEDDGLGIMGAVHEDGRAHSGLTHIKEQASLIDADLSIQSKESLGTTVSLRLKCQDDHKTASA